MADSVIISFIVSAWRTIVRWYDASMISRAINALCGFFAKRAKGSLIVRGFMHGVCSGQWWQNSMVYRLIALPLSGRRAERKHDSVILSALLDIFNVPLRSIGLILIDAAAGMAVSMGIRGNYAGVVHLIVLCCLVFLGTICLLLQRSAYELFLGSRILRFIAGFFTQVEYPEPRQRKIRTIPVCIFAALLGAVMGVFDPILPIAAAVGVLGAAVILARFEVGVFMIIFLAAFMPTAVMAALCILTFAGFLAALWTGRLQNLRPSSFAPLIAMYVLFGVFAAATSFHRVSSCYIFAVYLVFIGAYILIVNTLTTPERWRAAAVCFAAGALFISLYGIIQNFTMSVTTQSWVDANMFEDIKTRVYATFDNPNVLGQYLIITIPLIFALFVNERRPAQKGTYLVMFAVCFACLMYTWSRGAWVGVMLGIVVYLLLKDKRWIMLCILGLLAMPFLLPPSILNRLLSIGNLGDSSTAYRVSVWIASARMAMDFWMSGVGYGSKAFAAVYSAYALNGAGYALHSHNFYIQLVADMGVGGLITYILMLATAYREIVSVKNRSSLIGNVTLAAAGILAGYMFQGIAESLWYNLRMSLIFWILIALIVSGAKIDRTVTQQ